MGGGSTIIAIVIGAIMVIVGFALWPVLNGATNGLYSYFKDSCQDDSGNRFTKVYKGVTGAGFPGTGQYNLDTGTHGSGGVKITNSSGSCVGSSATVFDGATAITVYNEQGNFLGDLTPATGVVTLGATYSWVKVANVLRKFSSINDLLLTILPVVSIAGFLGISGAKLYSYGKGAEAIGSTISTSVFTLIGIVVALVIAAPIMAAVVDANQVVESGQFEVNNGFGNIIQLLFAMIPVVYIAGLVTVVGMQAKSVLVGAKSF